MRVRYIDNIRVGTVVLVLIYHVFYIYNSAGVPGGIGAGTGAEVGIKWCDSLLYFVYPWIMTLLFLIAGISARYALQNKSSKQFISERVTKLLVPSTLGLFIYQWIGGYLNVKIGGGLEAISVPMAYPFSVLVGIGPLWFIQMLFLFSLLLILLRKLDSKDRLWNFCGKSNIVILILLALPVWGAAQILNTPLITVYRFGIYCLAFLLGYFVFSHDKVQETVAKIHIPLLIAAVVLGVLYVYYYFGSDYTSPQCLRSLFTNVYLWIAILAIIGCGKKWLDIEVGFLKYLNRAGYGLYIMHYPIVLASCWMLYNYLALPKGLNYVLALIAEFALTILIYEAFKRIPVIRYLVLGIKKRYD